MKKDAKEGKYLIQGNRVMCDKGDAESTILAQNTHTHTHTHTQRE